MSEFLPGKERFKDQGELIYEFIDEFLVECPKCAGLAKVVLAEEPPKKKVALFVPRRLVCLKCSHIEACDGKKTFGDAGVDWYFERPLWLQIACCGNTLWALNERHLDFIESYVSARLRMRKPGVNRSVASRFPKWITAAKNRAAILKGIAKLKEKLNGKS